MLVIENDGPEIVYTNYFDTIIAACGYFYLSINAGAFRLLVPNSMAGEIDEWLTAREVIVSRGPWPDAGKHDAVEILFEDDSDSPYALHFVTEQMDRLPPDSSMDRPGRPPRWEFNVWTRQGKAFAADLPAALQARQENSAPGKISEPIIRSSPAADLVSSRTSMRTPEAPASLASPDRVIKY